MTKKKQQKPMIDPSDPRIIETKSIQVPKSIFEIQNVYNTRKFRFSTSQDILEFIEFAANNPHIIKGITYCEPEVESTRYSYDQDNHYTGFFNMNFTYMETEELAIERINDYIRRAIANKEELEKKAARDAARREKREKEQLLRLANKYGIELPPTIKE